MIHYRLLDYYRTLGLKISKVHRIISFTEKPWLKAYIDFNTNQRTIAKTNFEKDLWKLMNNSFYGKTVENIRNRVDIEIVNDEKRGLKLQTHPLHKGSTILNDDLAIYKKNIRQITFDKPIYTGMCVLDLSKLLMYQFYYEIINKKWYNLNEVLYFDTDSYFLNIQTEDVYKDLEAIQDELDTSDYPKDHKLFSAKNKKVIGKFKDELNGELITEACFLKAKQYSFKSTKSSTKKLKGISRTVIKNKINHDDYINCIKTMGTSYVNMKKLQSKKHEIYLTDQKKKAFSPFDDKRYIYNDGIKTDPHGIEKLNFI